MLISPENSKVFMKVGMHHKIPIPQTAELLVKIFACLIEFQAKICVMDYDIYDNGAMLRVTAQEGEFYTAFYDAMRRDLVWDTSTCSIDYEASVDRWMRLLALDEGIMENQLTLMQDNCDNAELKTFKEALTMFLVSCTRSNSRLLASIHWMDHYADRVAV